ncbi:hypothetical protein KIN20_017563 [Parelaphostrongylus tenuis]|uniref:Mos1 transposase HTH domain-containing protein n=1 Tax=Parelaphostrongylus tenuis TaxID=148309 RepID=A0AAD5QRK5_PARTN|nr:hypothetical protein KIN20_017563 [Parelaphostrongylus tenuis]
MDQSHLDPPFMRGPCPSTQSKFVLHWVTTGERIFPQRAAVDDINKVEKEGTTNKSAAGRWFQCFYARNLDLEGNLRSGRPTKLNNKDQLIAALEDELSSSARE